MPACIFITSISICEKILTPYYIGKGKGNRAYTKRRTEISKPDDVSRIQIVAHNLTETEAHLLEMKLIAYYGRKDIGTGILRNLTNGGDGASGRRMTQQLKNKIISANTGKPRTRETKAKISAANTGKQHTEETKKRIAKVNSEKWTDEMKVERSKQLTGRKLSEETKLKMSMAKKGRPAHNKGKTISEETKKKISDAMRGKPAHNKGKQRNANPTK